MRKVHWLELTTEDFAGLDPEKTIAVLPIAAIEQHGPHLAVSTDTIIGQGMVDSVIAKLPADLSVLFLPVQAVGKSNEHIRSPGTITYTAETAQRVWTEIGESVARAGVRKMIIVTSHGGNVDVMGIVARELRVNCRMLVVTTGWRRLGLPKGLYTDQEALHGIHAGDIETSMMLHFRPDLVRMEKAENFVPSSVRMENEFKFLRPTGFFAHGWIAQDIHPAGAAGDASLATAEKGKATAEYQAERFIELLRDVEKFSLERLA
jgi:creatinine amidohydrolase